MEYFVKTTVGTHVSTETFESFKEAEAFFWDEVKSIDHNHEDQKKGLVKAGPYRFMGYSMGSVELDTLE